MHECKRELERARNTCSISVCVHFIAFVYVMSLSPFQQILYAVFISTHWSSLSKSLICSINETLFCAQMSRWSLKLRKMKGKKFEISFWLNAKTQFFFLSIQPWMVYHIWNYVFISQITCFLPSFCVIVIFNASISLFQTHYTRSLSHNRFFFLSSHS